MLICKIKFFKIKGVVMSLEDVMNSLADYKKPYDTLQKNLKKIKSLEKDRQTNIWKIVSIVNTIEQSSDNFADIPELQNLRSWIDSYNKEIMKTKDEVAHKFGLLLEECLGMKLEGRYSSGLQAGIFSIVCDFDKKRATIWFGKKDIEELVTVSLSVKTVADKIKYLTEDLNSGFEKEEFLQHLRSAYDNVMRQHKKGLMIKEQKAPIINVLREMAILTQSRSFKENPSKENYRGYSRAQFSYDLFRYRQAHKYSLEVAARGNTQSRSKFLWVPDDNLGNGAVYSHLEIKE